MNTDIKDIFHAISYLQYPFMIVGLYFAFSPYLSEINSNTIFIGINNALVFIGIGVSFSTLQDPTKTQNNFSKRIWENPQKGKRTLILMATMAIAFIIVGLIGFLGNPNGILHEVSLGLIVLGIGYVGLIKVAIEMFENHRKDKNPQ